MLKLLNASFYRLFRNKTFWICFGISSALAVINTVCACITHCVGIKTDPVNGGVPLEMHYFTYHYVVSILTAVFASLFIGSEYSDGTVRNKLIVGKQRYSVYLSCFIVVLAACMIMAAVWIVVGLLGMPVMGNFVTGVNVLACIGIGVLALIALCAIYTFIGMLISNRAVSAVVMLLTTVVTVVAATWCIAVLSAPPEYMSWELVNGEMQQIFIPNKSYPTGAYRGFLEFTVDFLSMGQFLMMPDLARPINMAAYSVTITVVFTVSGALAFSYKHIK